MTAEWLAALAEYAAAMAAAPESLTDAQLRRIVDAKAELELQHHAVLLRPLARIAKREEANRAAD